MKLIELLYPGRCPLCDRVQPLGQLICPKCSSTLKPLKGAFCRKCGRQLKDIRLEYCPECLNKKHIFNEGRVLFDYRDIRRSVYKLKYMNRQEYALFYGKAMARELGATIKAWKVDTIIPVPLHPKRQRKRGYNQAALIARVLGAELSIQVREDIVRRIRYTPPLKTLNSKQRENNLKRAFKIDRDVVKLGAIALVDDIYTTGSTIDAISYGLRKMGVKDIFYVALGIS